MIRPELRPHIAAMKDAAAGFGKGAGLQNSVASISAFGKACHAALDALEQAFAEDDARRWQSAPVDGDKASAAKIAALEAELAALRSRHAGDVSGIAATLSRGAGRPALTDAKRDLAAGFGGLGGH